MPTIPCNTGHFCYRHGTRFGEFTPRKTPLYHHGEQNNRKVGWRAKGGVYSALLMVGLESPSGKTYSVDDVIDVVERVRCKQTKDPSSSFIVQKGLYKHKTGGEVVHEDSVRVIILHVTDETLDAFKNHILALGERLARDLQQEEVIVEFQNRGVTDEVIGVTK